MGMEIYGNKPSGQGGEYFRTSRYFWGPLAAYCIAVAPEISSACTYWFGNDRDGLDAAGALALADALQKEVDSGRVDTVVQQYASEQALLPDELCDSCLFEREVNCSECHGTGFLRPVPPFSTKHVCEFIAFLRQSGGFAIC